MLTWALVCFLGTIVTGLLGFGGGLSAVAGLVARGLFLLFLMVFAVSFSLGVLGAAMG